ncbi:hypothetical protein C4K35_0722 [Pseudomonas chlororaphis subsp. piscium]|nr:hypothetical protein C4K35_0722 [Pseudomonas chlororaphis subsp. piscium]AZC54909.1 hypothetical protein C4K34_0717 [Pseudomonas chlororaphis subsp. piscium]AZC61231.1 hypothetical protein C4K33_0712 [Pseudomonas chlororaphis subsp. piscium]AZC67454.1 hypothetical protein C4K32_0765 [Pseudomonas chlororaphis subsp. piscium]AZC79868.1 hypothetical protein C4K30_0727 [Pseudomonas chlororaphis subsp. piscium]
MIGLSGIPCEEDVFFKIAGRLFEPYRSLRQRLRDSRAQKIRPRPDFLCL